jgi:dipeptidyl aminopeptidase/acylaminoacyl peptidase
MIFQEGKRVLLSLLAALVLVCSLQAQTKLLRFPDVHGDKVVFTCGGDLWLASTSAGLATRLTAHPGVGVFAKFSPDGKWIAFTGQYDGDEQVYIIPATGGIPKYVIEGHGVDADIDIENDPTAVIGGRDTQLERGISEVMKALGARPKVLPPRPTDPVDHPRP